MRAMRTICAVAVAVAMSGAARGESVFDVEADSLLPDVGGLPSLSSKWGGATYQLSPGYTYLSSESENLTLTTNMFQITGFSEGISVDAGPITLQPLLQKAGRWSLSYGTAELDDGTTTEDGETCAFDATTVGSNGVGMGVSYSYIGSDNDLLWIETSSLSILFDYAEGGRLSLNASTADLTIDFLGIYIINNTVNWGVGWNQVLEFSRSWLSLGAGWARVENKTLGAATIDMGDRTEARAVFYPTVQFGISAKGIQERGDSGDEDGYGGGIIVDMEQVRLTVEFERTDVEGVPADSAEKWTVSLGMRF